MRGRSRNTFMFKYSVFDVIYFDKNMFKTVLLIFCFTQYLNTVQSQIWPQNEPSTRSVIPANRSRPIESPGNVSDTVTGILINVNTHGAPRALNSTNVRRSESHHTKRDLKAANRRTSQRGGKDLHFVTSSPSSNPKNDVEVFAPLEGAAPGYGPQTPQSPNFPPSLPDYPGGVYPYEPPYYYPFYSNEDPPYQPYYPPVRPEHPFYPRPPSRVHPVTRSNHNHPEYSTVVRTHETEPTTAVTPKDGKHKPASEPEPEVIETLPRRATLRPQTTKMPNFTTRKPWTYFDATQSYTPKATVRRQTYPYNSVTPSYPYDPFTTVTPVYGTLNYSPTTVDPRTICYPWPQPQGQVAPAPIHPYLTNYPAYYEPPTVQIGGRGTNKTAEKLIDAPWMPSSRAVEIEGESSALDPKYKLAVVSNYENFNETAGTFGFDIDLENGLTVHIRGYKKNGKQILDGSFSLFTNEGEPVKITYTADSENEILSTNGTSKSKRKVPKHGDEDSTVKEETVVATTEFRR